MRGYMDRSSSNAEPLNLNSSCSQASVFSCNSSSSRDAVVTISGSGLLEETDAAA